MQDQLESDIYQAMLIAWYPHDTQKTKKLQAPRAKLPHHHWIVADNNLVYSPLYLII